MTTPEVNLHIVLTDNQSKKKEKNKNGELWKWIKKVTKQEECQCQKYNPSKLNSFTNRNSFFGDWPRRAARIDS